MKSILESGLAAVKLPHPSPPRYKLPEERESITHHFDIHALEGVRGFYLTCGLYSDGKLGEVFVTAGREGSLISAALDGHSAAISIGLQHGVPLECYTAKMRHTQFEPAGFVDGAPDELAKGGRLIAKSPFDYIAMYLDFRFPNGYVRR